MTISNGIGLCHSEYVPQKREICLAPTVVNNRERTDRMGKFIWIRGVGIGGYHIL